MTSDQVQAPEAVQPPENEDKKAAAAAKRRQKAQKREKDKLWREYLKSLKVVPKEGRRIICPPDKATFTPGKTVRGYAARIAVTALTVFGVSFLLCSSFAIGEAVEGLSSGWILFLCSVLFTTLFSLSQILPPRKIAAPAGILLTAGIFILFFLPNPFVRMYESGIAAFNSALSHLTEVGFYAAEKSRIDFAYTTGTEAELARSALVAAAFVYSAVYSFCLTRKINVAKLIPAVLVSAATPALVFIYNITRSNWAVSITTAAFAAVLTLAGYDLIFSRRRRSKKTTSAELLYPQGADDEIPASDRKRLRLERRRAAAEARAARKASKKKEKTVDEEISEYFAVKPEKAKKAPKKKLTKAEKAAAAEQKRKERAEKREERRKIREAKDRRFARRRTAAAGGGFASLTVFIIAFLLMFIPSLITERPFSTFKALDDKFELIRTYVTAVLMGDDPVLDLLTFEHDASNFSPRSTEPTPRYYKGTQLFRVYSNTRQNVYLKGWSAVDYDVETGYWTTVSPGSELLDNYRYLFGTSIDPSESLMYGFHTLYDPSVIPSEDELDYTKRSRSNTSIGFVVSQVSVLPIEKPWSKLVFMPAYNLRQMNVTDKLSSGKSALFLRGFAGEGSSGLTYSNWFDGVYSSYRYSLPNDGFSVVAMIPTMKNSNYYRTLSDRIAAFNAAVYQISEGDYTFYIDSDGNRLQVDYTGNMMDTASKQASVTYFDDKNNPVQNVVYTMTDDGKITKTERTAISWNPEDEDAPYVPVPELPLALKYVTLAETAYKGRFDQYAKILGYYTNFVYATYTSPSGLASVTDLLNTIKSSATRKDYEEYEEYDEETGETYVLTRQITVPADFSRAAEHNVYKKVAEGKDGYKYVLETPVTDREVYRQRHELVMEIVNYLADEDNFTYTLTPAASAEGAVGIEKFLTGNRQGYCVQFATTLALLLREEGIPARYVDGYIAQSLQPVRDEAAGTYAANVADRNAHSWVEVWYDGIGWVPYEATPPYYDGMYETRRTENPGTIRPSGDGDDETDDPIDDNPISDAELERLEAERQRELRRQLIKKIIIISLSVLAAAAVISLILFVIARRAKRAELRRRALLERLEESGKKDGPEPEREDVRALSDLLFRLLGVCGLSPSAGEFTNEYCERLCDKAAPALMAGSTDPIEVRLPTLTRTDVRHAFAAIASEEFGFGCAKKEIPNLVTLYRRLYSFEYKRHVNPFIRLKLYYIDNTL